MAGPWEKYASSEEPSGAGPWSAYAGKSVEPQDLTFSEAAKAGSSGAIRGAASAADFMAGVTDFLSKAPQTIGEYVGEKTGITDAIASSLNYLGIGEAPPSSVTKLMKFPENEPKTLRQVASDVTGGYSEYVSPSEGGRIIGTAGEFIGGSAAMPVGGYSSVAQGLKTLGTAALSGAASEKAGQLTEGTKVEPYARIAAAIMAPSLASKGASIVTRPYTAYVKPSMVAKSLNTGNKTLDTVLAKAITNPTRENNIMAKNVAYKIADDLGVTFDQTKIQGIAANARNNLYSGTGVGTKFNPKYDTHIKEALDRIDDAASSPQSLIDMDNLKREIYSIYKRGLGQGVKPYDTRMKLILDEIDNVIDSSLQGSKALNAAKTLHKRAKKIQILDDAMGQAELNADVSGNVITKYKQAVKKIINSKDASYFDEGELNAMREILSSNVTQKTLNQFGKLSPTTNNLLMLVSSIGAYVNPSTMVLSGAGLFSKFGSDQLVKMQLADLQRLLNAGIKPAETTLPLAPRVTGLTAQQEQ